MHPCQRLCKLDKARIQKRLAPRHSNQPYFPRFAKPLRDMPGTVLSTLRVFGPSFFVHRLLKTVLTIEVAPPIHPPEYIELGLCLNSFLFLFNHCSVSLPCLDIQRLAANKKMSAG
jgi:hypothetical protein